MSPLIKMTILILTVAAFVQLVYGAFYLESGQTIYELIK